MFYVNLHLNFDIEERYIPGIMNTKSIVNDFTFLFKDRDGYIKGDIYALKLLTLDSIQTLTFKQVAERDGYCKILQPTILKLLPKTQVRCMRLKVPILSNAIIEFLQESTLSISCAELEIN